MTDRVAGATIVPLEGWVSLHPAAMAFARGEITLPAGAGVATPRSQALADVLATANRRWGNPVDAELAAWRVGADAVVTGQQPGLLGGPLLTLVKAAAVVAEVRRRKASGRPAVGFLWLATGDDDLPEMGWGRLAVGEELAEVREDGWGRAQELGGTVALSAACAAFLDSVRTRLPGGHAEAALALAAECYAPGVRLGEATARFLSRLLAGTGVVLIDALEPELARAAAGLTTNVLTALPQCWEALEAGTSELRARGWSAPLRISPGRLPLFRRAGDRRETVATIRGACPPAVAREHEAHPERFLPNAWLRPLVADAALGSAVSILGGAELAYHLQTAPVREVAGAGRPEWRLRPHVTVVTSSERRLAAQLRVGPEHVLRAQPPAHALPGGATRRRLATLRTATGERVAALAAAARSELPGLAGDIEATAKKLEGTLGWLEGRLDATAARDAETEVARWRRLRAFLRPGGQPQERHLSVLAPLVRLGLEWPRGLAECVDPAHPGMHLLFWEEGGAW